MTDGSQLAPGEKEAFEAVQVSAHMPPDMARNYLEMLGCAAMHFMRAKFGAEYTRGWLESAIADLDQPPLVELRRRH